MNLLPPYQKMAIEAEIMLRFYAVILGISVFLAVLFLALLYNSLLYINLQIPAVEERLAREKVTQRAGTVESVESEINALNDTLETIAKIRKMDTLNFPYILRVLGSVAPQGAEFRSIVFQKENISISGHADERDQVLAIEKNLKSHDIFTNVSSPLSNIVKERDINFSFTFSLNGQQ